VKGRKRWTSWSRNTAKKSSNRGGSVGISKSGKKGRRLKTREGMPETKKEGNEHDAKIR